MQDDVVLCFWYFFIREWDFAGRRMEEESIETFSLSTKQAKRGGGGSGGLSVLEESHVVGESGQLLLVWNQ